MNYGFVWSASDLQVCTVLSLTTAYLYPFARTPYHLLAESKEAAEYKQRNIEMESKVKDLDNLISQRDGEISELRLEIAALEGEIQGGASRGLPDPSAGQSSSRARIENKRRASESKLRALMGQVAHSIDKRKDPDGFGTSRAIAVDSDEDASAADEHVGLIHHSHVQEVKLKLQATEEALENTQRELDELRKESGSSTAVGSDILRSKSVDSAMPGVGKELSGELKEERARAQSLEAQLASANDAVRSRDKSSAELRGSLKEAVSLLKPLKEHVAQAERQKEELRNELTKSEERISALERQLSADGGHQPTSPVLSSSFTAKNKKSTGSRKKSRVWKRHSSKLVLNYQARRNVFR